MLRPTICLLVLSSLCACTTMSNPVPPPVSTAEAPTVDALASAVSALGVDAPIDAEPITPKQDQGTAKATPVSIDPSTATSAWADGKPAPVEAPVVAEPPDTNAAPPALVANTTTPAMPVAVTNAPAPPEVAADPVPVVAPAAPANRLPNSSILPPAPPERRLVTISSPGNAPIRLARQRSKTAAPVEKTERSYGGRVDASRF